MKKSIEKGMDSEDALFQNKIMDMRGPGGKLGIDAVHSLAMNHELRDYGTLWTSSQLYVTLFQCMKEMIRLNCYHKASEHEFKLWEIWRFVWESHEEFNCNDAIEQIYQCNEINLTGNTTFVNSILDRIVCLATRGGGDYGKEVSGMQAYCLRSAQCVYHWIYKPFPNILPVLTTLPGLILKPVVIIPT